MDNYLLGYRYGMEVESARKVLGSNFKAPDCVKCDSKSRWMMYQNMDEETGLPYNDPGIEDCAMCLDCFEKVYEEAFNKFNSNIGVN